VNAVELDNYLKRIGYDGPDDVPPTLQTLRAVQWCHACSIPFENLDVLLHDGHGGIKIDAQGVFQKLVVGQRGGYCFEQNSLLLDALEAIGFEVQGLSGRVGDDRSVTPPRTHLFAKVMLEGVAWLVDVGVGGFTPTCPLRMDTDELQETPHDVRRIVLDDGTPDGSGIPLWYHQVLIGKRWRDVYRFTGELMPGIDREVGNWWTSTHPESKFRQSIMAAIASPDGSRHTLATSLYTHRLRGEVIEEEVIGSSRRLLGILDERFGIVLPKGTQLGIGGF